MELFDIISDISVAETQKTETGDNRIYGVLLGTVQNKYDAKMPGRVCVNVTTKDQEQDQMLMWVRVAQPSSGSKWGHYFLPEVGDQVLLAFEQGNIERPYIIGCVPKYDKDQFIKGVVDENNKTKAITTKHGSTITFTDDNEAEDGTKDKIRIETAANAHIVELDNDKGMITIADKDKKNSIVIKTADDNGNIAIQTEKKLTIKVGNSIELTMNDSSGTVNLKCTKFVVDSSGTGAKVELKTSGEFSASGRTFKGAGSASTTVGDGASSTTVTGSMIKNK
ncbi:MAG: phage baseplate assembly protein V [Lachnospiraceae bacterium]|nr:phage baseplate assembly protein V [Lachnospiraceae bacterium]